jgi:hypothetical protein
MKMTINSNSQLELSIQNQQPARPLTARQRRRQNAAIWFSRMKEVVERATGWNPAPPPRPEQRWFPNATRSSLVSHSNS